MHARATGALPLCTSSRNWFGESTSSYLRPRRFFHFSVVPRTSANRRFSCPRRFNSDTRLRPIKPTAPVTIIVWLINLLLVSVDLQHAFDGAGRGAAFHHVGQDD